MQLGRVIRHIGVPLPFNCTSKPPLNKLYNYSNKTVKYSGNPKGEVRTIILEYHIEKQGTHLT